MPYYKKENEGKRFVIKEKQTFGVSEIQIIVDTVTGVNYICTSISGLTPLLDSSGNVVIDKISDK